MSERHILQHPDIAATICPNPHPLPALEHKLWLRSIAAGYGTFNRGFRFGVGQLTPKIARIGGISEACVKIDGAGENQFFDLTIGSATCPQCLRTAWHRAKSLPLARL